MFFFGFWIFGFLRCQFFFCDPNMSFCFLCVALVCRFVMWTNNLFVLTVGYQMLGTLGAERSSCFLCLLIWCLAWYWFGIGFVGLVLVS